VRTMIVLILEIVLLSTWMLTDASPSQVTPALGRLHITSMPTGASITINGKLRPELTNVTLVVNPGKYTVSVTDGSKLNCRSKTVQVSKGQTVEVTCP
jgi:hypothetical protein